MTLGSAETNIKEWRENPCKYVHDEFGATPDKWQEDVLDSFASDDPLKRRISMSACAGPGKSTALAWCGLNFLSCYGHKGEHPKGAALSCTADNLKDNLWPELAKWMGRSEYLTTAFKWTKTRIYSIDHDATWFLSARSFPKTSDVEELGRTLSGMHSKYVLYLIDESGDIHPAVLKSAEQGLSNCIFGKIIQAGNPTSHEGMLYLASTAQAHKWFTVNITGDPDDPKRSPRIDIDWAREQIELYGRDDPWVMAYILGQFPPSSINSLLGPEEVDAAMARHLDITDYQHSQKRLGVDVARYGDDDNVLFPRQGLVAFKPAIMKNADGPAIAARIMLAKSRWGTEVTFLDDTGGYGATVIDSLHQAGESPIPVCFSGKADDPRYFNKRSEMYFRMAKWVKKGGALPKDPQLKRELTTPTYTFQNGKFLLEPKKMIKKRLKFSPDRADGLCLTFAIVDLPSDRVDHRILRDSKTKLLADYDPFSDDRM